MQICSEVDIKQVSKNALHTTLVFVFVIVDLVLDFLESFVVDFFVFILFSLVPSLSDFLQIVLQSLILCKAPHSVRVRFTQNR